MNNENYIVINGKKIELTEEQLKQLGIKDNKVNTPFDRVKNHETYYCIESNGVKEYKESFVETDNLYFDNANYFNDKDFANQVMLHQQLYRMILKYAHVKNAIVSEKEWENVSCVKYFIYHDNEPNEYLVGRTQIAKKCLNNVYFNDEKIARDAIVEIVEPFVRIHSEFVW